MQNQTEIKKLEQGRAEFAYKCVKEVIKLEQNPQSDEFKENVKKKLDEKIQKNKITEERIEELLTKPDGFVKQQNALKDEEKQVLKEYKKLLENYRSYSRRIPTMILTNGLGQTLAFMKAKSEKGNAYSFLYQQITNYLKSGKASRITMPPDKNELIEWVISCDSKEYKFITQELLAFLNWLRRFAEGMIEGEEK